MCDGYKEVYGIIYLARCIDNGKVYIGQTIKTLGCRKAQHIHCAFNEQIDGYDSYWYRALRTHGIDKFEWNIIYDNVPESLLSRTERFAIGLYNSFGSGGYNSTGGGDESPSKNPDVAHKISLAKMGDNNPMRNPETAHKVSVALTGKKLTQETKDKIGNAHRGMKRTDETRANISKSHMGDKNPMFGTTAWNNGLPSEQQPFFGHHFSETAKRKLSISNTGKIHTSDCKDKMAILHGGRKFCILKNGIVLETFIRQTSCAEKYNIDSKQISACLHGKHKTASGYTFAYVEDYNKEELENGTVSKA